MAAPEAARRALSSTAETELTVTGSTFDCRPATARQAGNDGGGPLGGHMQVWVVRLR